MPKRNLRTFLSSNGGGVDAVGVDVDGGSNVPAVGVNSIHDDAEHDNNDDGGNRSLQHMVESERISPDSSGSSRLGETVEPLEEQSRRREVGFSVYILEEDAADDSGGDGSSSVEAAPPAGGDHHNIAAHEDPHESSGSVGFGVFALDDFHDLDGGDDGSDQAVEPAVVDETEPAVVDETAVSEELAEGDSLLNSTVHEKESPENTLLFPTFPPTRSPLPPTSSPTPLPTHTPTTSSPTTTPTTHLQSLHLILKNYADSHLKELDQGGNNGLDTEFLHQKSSLEKNGENLPEDRPKRWDPPFEFEDTSIESAPRVPYQEGEEEDLKECKSQKGSFGSKNGGVVLRYQYELTEDVRKSNGLESDILPSLETAITDSLLPVFFGEECKGYSPERASMGMKSMFDENAQVKELVEGPVPRDGNGRRRRLQVLGMDVEVEYEHRVSIVESPRFMLRGGGRNRRLANDRVVGIDSNPTDFALDKECDFPLPNINSQCHSMEGALTLYFPPNYSIHTLVQGAQLTTLNALRESMAYGDLARMSHEAILKLKLLDSSYSLRPVIPPELQIKNEEEKGGNKGGLIAGILIPLILICCCGFCCLNAWRRRGGEVPTIYDLIKKKSSGWSSSDGDSSSDTSSLHKPKKSKKSKKAKDKKKKLKIKGKFKKKKSRGSNSSGGSVGTDADDENEDDEPVLNPQAEQLMEDLQDANHFFEAANAEGGSVGSNSKKKKKKGKNKKSKKDKKNKGKNKSSGEEDDSDVMADLLNESTARNRKSNAEDAMDDLFNSSRSSNMHRRRRSQDSVNSSGLRRSQLSATGRNRRRGSMDSRVARERSEGLRQSLNSNFTFESTDSENSDTDGDNTFGNNTTSTSTDSTTDDNDSTTSSGSDSDSNSSTTSSDRGTTTDGSTTTSSRGQGTTSTSTSDDDNNSTTTSTSDNSTTSSGDSSDDDSEDGDQFDMGGPGGFQSQSQWMSHRRGVRQRQQRATGGRNARAARGRGSKPKTNMNNNNLVIGGVVEDDSSVMTGMTGATGMHSLSSVATAQVKNKNVRIPMSIGGGGDDMSVMTGVSAATRQVRNTGGGGGRAGIVGGDDLSVMTGISAATRPMSNTGGGGIATAGGGDDLSVMTGMTGATERVTNAGGGVGIYGGGVGGMYGGSGGGAPTFSEF